jgi:hopanoid biosynthesis associated RND transporter like protein HpnN
MPNNSNTGHTRLNPHATPNSISVRLLTRLADAIYHHRRWFFYPQLVLATAALFYTISFLEFRTNRSALVGGEKEYHRIYLEFRKEFPIQDDLVVVVQSSDLERNRQFMERLGTKIQQETNLFANVFFKGDLHLLGPKALLFLSETNLRELKETLSQFLPMLKTFSAATNLISLFDLVNTQIRTAQREESDENRSLVKALPALARILALAHDGLQRSGSPPSPGLYSLFERGKEAAKKAYITFNDGRIFLLTTQARHDKLQSKAITRLRQLIAETQQEVPGLNVGLTGEPVLETDEMVQSQKDTSLATVVSLIGVALIFIYGYHETGRPLKATACLVVGLIYTLGFTTLTIGHLNILTITFVPILIGLAIDFGVHLISRYEEELWHGRTEQVALQKALVNTGTGIFTGAFTTAGAFFAMVATDFNGIQEMGWICGSGMLLCLVPMMTMLPVLILSGQQNVLDHELGPKLDLRALTEQSQRARLENIWLQRPILVVVLVVLLSVPAVYSTRTVKFDYNLLNMQTANLPAVIFQDKLIETSPRSVLFAAVVAPSAIEATNLAAALTNLPSVASIDSMSFLLTEDQTGKLALLREIKKQVAQVEFKPIDTEPVQVDELIRTLWSLHGYLSLAVREVEGTSELSPAVREVEGTSESSPAVREVEGISESELLTELRRLLDTITDFLRALRVADKTSSAAKLATYQQALFQDVHQTFESIRDQDDRTPMQAKDLPPALRERFIGVSGLHLLQVYPKKNVWNREEQEQFIGELRKIQRTVTGTPVQLYEYTTLLKVSYEHAALYALGTIALLVFMHFRSLACVVLALLPVGLGAFWTTGFMGLFHVSFNPANVIMLPLIIGIGVTNGIHILNRFEEEQHPSILARSTGKAVLVSGLTTIAGFGSLMLGQHRGIQSLGFVMATGVTACMVIAITFLPAILNLLTTAGWRLKKPSVIMHNQHWVGRNRGKPSISAPE